MKSFAASAPAANPSAAWQALQEVIDWPNWTESVTSIEGPPGDITAGQSFRVTQPRMPQLVWTVTDVKNRRGFSWSAKSPGVSTVGHHWLSTDDNNVTTIHVSIEQTGPLAWLVWALTNRRTKRYLQLEANGLAAASKQASMRERLREGR
jgi:hypothetical protein